MVKIRNVGLWVSSILGRAQGTAPIGYGVAKQILNDDIVHPLVCTIQK
jgi:uncharacterized protein YwbE